MGTKYWTLLFGAINLALLDNVCGNGRLLIPPQRSSLWRDPIFYRNRYVFKNYDDHTLNCGGFWKMHENDGKCGVCGDPWDDEEPRPNEAGGVYARGVIGRTYSTDKRFIDALVQVTSSMSGYFEFNICPNDDIKKKVSQKCLDQFPLRILSKDRSTSYGRRYFPDIKPGLPGIVELSLEIPEGLECKQCVLQWRWHGANNFGKCRNGSWGKGCGEQPEIYNCADIAILPEHLINKIDGEIDDTPVKPRTTSTTTQKTTTKISTTNVPRTTVEVTPSEAPVTSPTGSLETTTTPKTESNTSPSVVSETSTSSDTRTVQPEPEPSAEEATSPKSEPAEPETDTQTTTHISRSTGVPSVIENVGSTESPADNSLVTTDKSTVTAAKQTSTETFNSVSTVTEKPTAQVTEAQAQVSTSKAEEQSTSQLPEQPTVTISGTQTSSNAPAEKTTFENTEVQTLIINASAEQSTVKIAEMQTTTTTATANAAREQTTVETTDRISISENVTTPLSNPSTDLPEEETSSQMKEIINTATSAEAITSAKPESEQITSTTTSIPNETTLKNDSISEKRGNNISVDITGSQTTTTVQSEQISTDKSRGTTEMMVPTEMPVRETTQHDSSSTGTPVDKTTAVSEVAQVTEASEVKVIVEITNASTLPENVDVTTGSKITIDQSTSPTQTDRSAGSTQTPSDITPESSSVVLTTSSMNFKEGTSLEPSSSTMSPNRSESNQPLVAASVLTSTGVPTNTTSEVSLVDLLNAISKIENVSSGELIDAISRPLNDIDAGVNVNKSKELTTINTTSSTEGNITTVRSMATNSANDNNESINASQSPDIDKQSTTETTMLTMSTTDMQVNPESQIDVVTSRTTRIVRPQGGRFGGGITVAKISPVDNIVNIDLNIPGGDANIEKEKTRLNEGS